MKSRGSHPGIALVSASPSHERRSRRSSGCRPPAPSHTLGGRGGRKRREGKEGGKGGGERREGKEHMERCEDGDGQKERLMQRHSEKPTDVCVCALCELHADVLPPRSLLSRIVRPDALSTLSAWISTVTDTPSPSYRELTRLAPPQCRFSPAARSPR